MTLGSCCASSCIKHPPPHDRLARKRFGSLDGCGWWVWPSAIFCWFYGKRLKAQAERDAVLETDPATGKTVRVVNVPELFWLPVQWWSVPCMVMGVWFWQAWAKGGMTVMVD